MDVYREYNESELQEMVGHEKQPPEHFSAFALVFLSLFGAACWIAVKVKSVFK